MSIACLFAPDGVAHTQPVDQVVSTILATPIHIPSFHNSMHKRKGKEGVTRDRQQLGRQGPLLQVVGSECVVCKSSIFVDTRMCILVTRRSDVGTSAPPPPRPADITASARP